VLIKSPEIKVSAGGDVAALGLLDQVIYDLPDSGRVIARGRLHSLSLRKKAIRAFL